MFWVKFEAATLLRSLFGFCWWLQCISLGILPSHHFTSIQALFKSFIYLPYLLSCSTIFFSTVNTPAWLNDNVNGLDTIMSLLSPHCQSEYLCWAKPRPYGWWDPPPCQWVVYAVSLMMYIIRYSCLYLRSSLHSQFCSYINQLCAHYRSRSACVHFTD